MKINVVSRHISKHGESYSCGIFRTFRFPAMPQVGDTVYLPSEDPDDWGVNYIVTERNYTLGKWGRVKATIYVEKVEDI
jgi:hypothetical protein